MFKRKTLIVSNSEEISSSQETKIKSTSDITVLVVNSSHEMAREITTQLILKFPFCSILYAPTIELARWILKRRSINLVVSSSTLPDGNIIKLKQTLEKLSNPPDVVVVGNMRIKNVELFSNSGYQFTGYKRIGNKNPSSSNAENLPVDSIVDSIKGLGENIRNDLNNPLQEIVAMVFIAAHSRGDESATGSALEAIEKAAKNMSGIVNSLEGKIMTAVANTK